MRQIAIYEKALLVLALALVSSRLFAADISVAVGEPGFYGRIVIGDFPQPEVIYGRPIIVEPAREAYAPIYLRVPPGYERHWDRHCREYHACRRPVYFVRDKWYREVYVPHWRRSHERHDEGRGYRDDRHDEERGRRGEGHERD